MSRPLRGINGRLLPLLKHLPFVAALGFLVLSRLAWLDADPSVFKRPGDISDEGLWWNAARTRVALGQWAFPEAPNVWGLWAGPLYTAAEVGAFRLGGVNFYAGRLPSALSGLAVLGLMYAAVRRDYGRRMALLAVMMLGLNVHFYDYNRLGLAETYRLLFIFAGAYVWCASDPRTPWGAGAGAALLGAAALAKVAPDILAYPLALWLMDWLGGRRGAHRRRLAAFAGGWALAGLALAVVVAASEPAVGQAVVSALRGVRLQQLAHPVNLPFLPYAVATNDLLASLPVLFLFVLALPALTDHISAIVASPRDWARRLNPLESTGAALSVGLAAIGLVYDHGDRRMFPVLLPLVLLAIQGASNRWQIASLASRLAWDRKRRALALAALGGWWISWWKSTSTVPWPDFSVGWWLAWLAAAAAVGAMLLVVHGLYRRAWPGDARVLLAAGVLSYLFALADRTGQTMAGQIFRWPVPRTATLLAAAGVTLAWAGLFLLKPRARPGLGGWGAAAAYGLFGLLAIGAHWSSLTFTARDASRQIGALVAPGEHLWVETSYDACTETRAKCEAVGMLRRRASQIKSGQYWLVFADREPVGGPAGSPCLYDEAGAPLAGLTRLQTFDIRRGPGVHHWILYELHDLEPSNCAETATAKRHGA